MQCHHTAIVHSVMLSLIVSAIVCALLNSSCTMYDGLFAFAELNFSLLFSQSTREKVLLYNYQIIR